MSQANKLHHYLDARLISVQLIVSSRKKLLQETARLLSLPLREIPPDNLEGNLEKDVYHALLEREKLGNTGIGNGIALPHCRLEHASEAVIAILTLTEPIDYDSNDRQPVDLAFGLVVPEKATQEHLTILAGIARMMSQPHTKKALTSATSAQQIIELITSWAPAGDQA